MISFTVCLILLILGYVIYGKFVEKVFGIDVNRLTPAYTHQDGVDFIPLSGWRVFLIQFLNIAGLGPIFGAIMGAKFGAGAYIWIVIGCIFAGAVHDYFSGMLSLRNSGMSFPEIVGKYLGKRFMTATRIFTPLMMILVGAVFVAGPAGILSNMTTGFFSQQQLSESIGGRTTAQWLFIFFSGLIFCYYILATLLPIDKVIGRIYPLFALALIFMAVGIFFSLYIYLPAIPEVTEGLTNTHPLAENMPIFPMLFITIACGALSGFHATQSPMMARCIKNERLGRPVFYGAMIAEGIVALIWAAAANYAFHTPQGQAFFQHTNAALVVDFITKNWLGTVGAVIATLGVVAAPISSGDTAFRSARLILADMFKIDQQPIIKRLLISGPLFLGGFLLILVDFSIVWRYFAWFNQALGALALWTVTVYLAKTGKNYWISLIPSCFITAVITAYIFVAPEALGLSEMIANFVAAGVVLACLICFFIWKRKDKTISAEERE